MKTGAVCGDANFTLYWFSGKPGIRTEGIFGGPQLRAQLEENCGIRIYNDGVRIMPYGECGNDWMGLDGRGAGPAGASRVRNPAVIGMVELTRAKNPGITETTTREAIRENDAFGSLRRDFLTRVIERLEAGVKALEAGEEEGIKRTRPGNIARTEISHAMDTVDGIPGIPADVKAQVRANLARASRQISMQERRARETEERLVSDTEMYRNLATVGIQTIAFNHEIIDPVRYVKLALENMTRLGDRMSEGDRDRYVADMLHRMTHTLNWANHMREFSGILAGAGTAERRRGPVEVYGTLLSIKKWMGPMLDALKITMDDPEVGPDVPEIRMNAASFESIFMNLTSNSVRALKRVRGRQPRIRISAGMEGEHVVIRFEDNGYGIADGHRDEIFKPFFTTYGSGRDGVGTGMGLAIVRDITETDCGGTVVLDRTVHEEDERGRGMTAFVLRLPVGGTGQA